MALEGGMALDGEYGTGVGVQSGGGFTAPWHCGNALTTPTPCENITFPQLRLRYVNMCNSNFYLLPNCRYS